MLCQCRAPGPCDNPQHAYAHEGFEVWLKAREVVRVFEPMSEERIDEMSVGEWHAAPLSATCDWVTHASMPKHARSHE